MSFKTVLVHVEPDPKCDHRVRLALRVADMFGATVTGLGAEAMDPMITSGYAATDGRLIEAVQERIAADLPAAEARFRAMTVGRPGALWIDEEDYPDRMLALHARGADLIVAGRPPTGVGPTYSARPADLVMEAGVPILLAADDEVPFVGEHVLVAWKDARESRRALSDALPFLKQAKSVTIAMVAGEADGQHERARRELSRRLLGHGVEPTFLTAPKSRGSVTEALETCAAERGADLIVAGAYGHSRLREWMLGGVTEDFVVSSRRFVLLSH